MSYDVYKVLHFLGIFMVFLSLGGVTIHVLNGGTKEHGARKLLGMTHGLGLFIALLGGFGLLARLGTGMQGWVYAKLVIWLFFGGFTALAYRRKLPAHILWILLIAVGTLAAFIARNKPF